MEENNLSQQKFADILEVSQKAVSNWLNEKDMPKASSILLIHKKFGIEPNVLLGIEEPNEIPPTNNQMKIAIVNF